MPPVQKKKSKNLSCKGRERKQPQVVLGRFRLEMRRNFFTKKWSGIEEAAQGSPSLEGSNVLGSCLDSVSLESFSTPEDSLIFWFQLEQL